jgi:hypothetical protein
MIERAYFAPMPARRLGALRVVVGAYALVYLLARSPHLLRFAAYDRAYFAPLGVLAFLDAPLPPALYRAAVGLTVALAVPFLLGVAHRVLAPLFALSLLTVLTYSNAFGKILNTDNLLVLHVGVLALAPSADALSLDARRRERSPAPHARYGWPIRLVCALTVLTYFLAGIAKLRESGLAFVGGETLRNYVAFDNVRKAELGSAYSPLGAALLGFPRLFALLSVASFGLELGAPLALLSRRVGRLWAAAAWAFHLGVLALMAIGFTYQLSFVAFAAFLDLERLRPFRGRGARASAAPEPAVRVAEEPAEGEARDHEGHHVRVRHHEHRPDEHPEREARREQAHGVRGVDAAAHVDVREERGDHAAHPAEDAHAESDLRDAGDERGGEDERREEAAAVHLLDP